MFAQNFSDSDSFLFEYEEIEYLIFPKILVNEYT